MIVSKVENENINLLRVCEVKFSALFQMNFTLSVFSQTQNVAHCAHAVQCAVFLIIFPSFEFTLLMHLALDDLKLIESEIKKKKRKVFLLVD